MRIYPHGWQCDCSILRRRGFSTLSKELELPTRNKQSFACLSARFVYGKIIIEEKLGMGDKAEQLLLDLDFHQAWVRIHGIIACIEILPEVFGKLPAEDVRKKLICSLSPSDLPM